MLESYETLTVRGDNLEEVISYTLSHISGSELLLADYEKYLRKQLNATGYATTDSYSAFGKNVQVIWTEKFRGSV